MHQKDRNLIYLWLNMCRGIIYVWLVLLLLGEFNSAVLAQVTDKFRIGIITYKSEEALKNTFQPLFDYLGESLGKQAQISLLAEEDLAFGLKQGEYDMGIFTPFPYLRAKLDYPELEVFASHTVAGEDVYHGCILIRKESGNTCTYPTKRQKIHVCKAQLNFWL